MKCRFLREDRPTLTVMIQAHTPERALELIRRGLEGGADAFGLQMEQLERKYQTREVLAELFHAMGGKPAYVTNYRGGTNEGKTDGELAEGLVLAAECGGALIDVIGDMFGPHPRQMTENEEAIGQQKALIAQIHALGAEVLMSSHTGCYLSPEEVVAMARQQAARGADIPKIVMISHNEQELGSAFLASGLLREQSLQHVLFLCGGECCTSHRRVAPLIGKSLYLCVVEHDELATSMQPLLSHARRIVESALANE